MAWYAMDLWLRDFAYHTEIKWYVFAIGALLALIIAFLTIGIQSAKAALVNPAMLLKGE
jgi:putative ABC transport system permease protein